MALVLCNDCQRHIRDSESACPFCAKPNRAAVAVAILAAATMAACYGGPPRPQQIDAPAPLPSASTAPTTPTAPSAGPAMDEPASIYGAPPPPHKPFAAPKSSDLRDEPPVGSRADLLRKKATLDMSLQLCSSCSRHVKEHEIACPFCDAPLGIVRSSGALGLTALAFAAATLAACTSPPAAIYGGPPPPPADSSLAVTPSATPSAAPTPPAALYGGPPPNVNPAPTPAPPASSSSPPKHQPDPVAVPAYGIPAPPPPPMRALYGGPPPRSGPPPNPATTMLDDEPPAGSRADLVRRGQG